ncbi:unnamed protein product [Orchesella dallaii]|uniref:Uncharacterized protein n=1 Tax=Orchesella dallaii TaxID=48710 RepID=A0ABP1Q0J8_9HEXA
MASHTFLQAFKNCSVHIVTAHVLNSNEPAPQNYQVDPTTVPIMHSVYFYRQNSTGWANPLYCNKENVAYFIEPNQGFVFKAPAPTLTCDVQVYICPLNCYQWMAPTAKLNLKGNPLVSPSYYSSYIDYRLMSKPISLSRSGLTLSWLEMNTSLLSWKVITH